MKMWNKIDLLSKKIEKFTVGNDRTYDLFIAKYDVQASIAHAKMLNKINILTNKELKLLVKELSKIRKSISKGDFILEDKFEDIHSKIEFSLVESLGEIGKKIHTGRSRNDQVLVATQLYLKNEIIEIKKLIKNLFDLLISLSNKNKNNLIPGYTHMQVAMPSSFGLWFSSYAECLIDDILYFNTAYKINNQNPLGSAAGYGSSFEIDREFTTKELGFETLKYNVVAAQMNRGKVEKSVAVAIGSVANTLSQLSNDICLYMAQEFNFIFFPEKITTGSSIMPHKKNPDVFELIRSKCNSVQSINNELNLISNNLASGYHRDKQLFKEKIISGIETTKDCLEVMIYSLKEIKVRKLILKDDKYKFIYSVENLNELVKKGVNFRDAYIEISESIKNKKFTPYKKINHSLKGGINNLCLREIKSKMKNNF